MTDDLQAFLVQDSCDGDARFGDALALPHNIFFGFRLQSPIKYYPNFYNNKFKIVSIKFYKVRK